MNLPVKREEPNLGRKLASYFIQGLLLAAPLLVTIYVFYLLIFYLDTLIPVDKWLPFPVPGLGLAIIVFFITAAGYFSNNYLLRPLFLYLEGLVIRLPLAKIIYSSLKDLFSAFISDEKKFDKPVLVVLSKESGVKKIGFITNSDLSELGRKDDVAVYFPHSYNFSGNLFIVPRENVILLEEHVSSAEAMKFIVSGGVTQIHENKSVKK